MFRAINKVIKILIVSDFFFNYAWGLIGPVFAIFIVQKITFSDPLEGAKVAGLSSLIYWVVKSLLQIPIGKYLDKNHGEKDDFWFMVVGTFIAGIVPFGYLISFRPAHIYGLQVLHAIAIALLLPPWMAIFTRHIDKGKEAYEWGLNSTVLGLAMGIAGGMAGLIVPVFGFEIIFILVGVFTIISAALLILIRKEIYPKDGFHRYLFFKPPTEPF